MASRLELGDDWDGYVDGLVRDGRFETRADVLREGVRLGQERESWQKMVDEAVAEGLADIDAGRTYSVEEVREHFRARPRDAA